MSNAEIKAYDIYKGANKGRWELASAETGKRVGYSTYATKAEAEAAIPEALAVITYQSEQIAARDAEQAAALEAQATAIYAEQHLATAAQRAYIQRLVDADPARSITYRLTDTLTKAQASGIIDALRAC